MYKKEREFTTAIGGVALTDFYANRMMDQFYAPSPFETDEMIDEVVPKYQFYIKIPYVRFDSDYQEIRIGFSYKVLFTWGKKKVQRRAYIWESKNKKGSVLKINRYEEAK